MQRGIILKGIGGFYTVLSEGREYILKPRGVFRLDGITPVPGDRVEFDPQQNVFDAVLERKSLLTRPKIANIDMVLAVISAKKPDPDYLLLERLLVSAKINGIKAVAVLNKCDGADDLTKRQFVEDYAMHSPVLTSAATGEGIEELKALVKGRVFCVAGQSGVGKSSIINAMAGAMLDTGELSHKTKRGRHTTRATELIPLPEGGVAADTPGFSLMELAPMPPEELSLLYPEFLPYADKCRFIGCMHYKEPDCAVKSAAEAGQISFRRWQRYTALLLETQEKWRSRYE